MGLTAQQAYKYPVAIGLGCTNVRTTNFISMPHNENNTLFLFENWIDIYEGVFCAVLLLRLYVKAHIALSDFMTP